ncbi:ribose ABC transport system [Cutibacterium acnes JCM 18920]|nr:ribose ABC transport system [Cutibacterium acnes JCM 18920]
MSGGSGKASGTFVGAVLLAVIRNGLNILNVSSFWQQVVIGCVIALAVGFDVFRSKKES